MGVVQERTKLVFDAFTIIINRGGAVRIHMGIIFTASIVSQGPSSREPSWNLLAYDIILNFNLRMCIYLGFDDI